MNPIADRQDILINAGDLNEKVLEDAAANGGDSPAPETPAGTAEITVWDESADAAGRRMPESPVEGEETISEQLVNAGNNEADREQRLAAGVGNG